MPRITLIGLSTVSAVALLTCLGPVAATAQLANGQAIGSLANNQINKESRVALVVGNSAYGKAGIPALPNTRNDASDMVPVLKGLGFTVVEAFDATKREFEDKLQQFERLAANADTALFYYAGHAMQYQGRNFFMPTDAELKDETSIRYEMVSMEDVRVALDRANGVKIMILDSCRNNPLADRLQSQMAKVSRSIAPATRGLARVDKTQGLVVAYATAAEDVASDGDGRSRNSPFTGALIKRLQEPGVEIGLMFRRVASDVNAQTGGRQRPETTISLLSEYYLNQSDDIAWQNVDKDSAAALRSFVDKYTSSPNAVTARNRIAVLEQLAKDRDEEAQRKQFEAERQKIADLQREALERLNKERVAAQQREAEDQKRRDEQARQLAAEQKRFEEEQKRFEAQRLQQVAEQKRLEDEQRRLEGERQQRLALQQNATEDTRREAARLQEAEQKRLEEASKRIEGEKQRLAALEQQQSEQRQRLLDQAQSQRDEDERRRQIVETCRRDEDRLAQIQSSGSDVREQLAKLRDDTSCKVLRPIVEAALEAFPPSMKPATGQIATFPMERLVRQAQFELRRIGCYPGTPDGALDDKTKDAVKKYWSNTKQSLVEVNITDEFISELEKRGDGVCPTPRPPRTADRPESTKPPVTHSPIRERNNDRVATPAPVQPREPARPFASAPPPRPPSSGGGGGAPHLGIGF